RIETMLEELKYARTELDRVAQELPTLKQEEFSPMAKRAEKVVEALIKGRDVTTQVSKDYQRILKQMEVNRVNQKFLDKIDDTIPKPLDKVIRPEGAFDKSEKSLRSFAKNLEEKIADERAADQAKQDLDVVINDLSRILAKMSDIVTINRLIKH